MKKELYVAPTEEIELEIVEFCINELGLTFGDFWYHWFENEKEIELRIMTNENIDVDLLHDAVKLSFVGTINGINKNVNFEEYNNVYILIIGK